MTIFRQSNIEFTCNMKHSCGKRRLTYICQTFLQGLLSAFPEVVGVEGETFKALLAFHGANDLQAARDSRQSRELNM